MVVMEQGIVTASEAEPTDSIGVTPGPNVSMCAPILTMRLEPAAHPTTVPMDVTPPAQQQLTVCVREAEPVVNFSVVEPTDFPPIIAINVVRR